MNINEWAQWLLLALFGVLILGLYRQLWFFLSGSNDSSSGEPVGGPPLRRRLPEMVIAAIRDEVSSFPCGESTRLAFVSEGCGTCGRLLAELASSNGVTDVIVIARTPSEPFRDALSTLPVPVVADSAAELWRLCDIQATPLIVTVDARAHVREKVVDHHVSSRRQAESNPVKQ